MTASGDSKLELAFDAPGHPASLESSVPGVYAEYGVRPTAVANDLLRAAAGAYTADVRIPRDEAYDRWTRDIALYLPVQETERWHAGSADTFEEILSFLTGDRWAVHVRAAPERYRPNRQHRGRRRRRAYRLDTCTVSLFSGGLDSYVGVIDHVETVGQVALVGHHAAGGGPTSVSQSRTHTALVQAYGERYVPFLHFWLSSPIGPNGASEITTRGRSILFLSLGIAVASGLGAERLVVPENGLISLNVPLTPARVGSFSTRTTHPYLIALFRRLLDRLGLAVELDTPYRFRTKGEMIAECGNQRVLNQGLADTMSCAHPGAGRWVASGNPNQHCGRCLPCLIRRAGIEATRADPTTYAWEDRTQGLSEGRGSDLRAVRIALERHAHATPGLPDVLASGPIPGTEDELDAYVDVFARGMEELRRWVYRGSEGGRG
jgi:hypothetical protein